jgi:hypothetical protein
VDGFLDEVAALVGAERLVDDGSVHLLGWEAFGVTGGDAVALAGETGVVPVTVTHR